MLNGIDKKPGTKRVVSPQLREAERIYFEPKGYTVEDIDTFVELMALSLKDLEKCKEELRKLGKEKAAKFVEFRKEYRQFSEGKKTELANKITSLESQRKQVEENTEKLIAAKESSAQICVKELTFSLKKMQLPNKPLDQNTKPVTTRPRILAK